jgi:magnesium transporter
MFLHRRRHKANRPPPGEAPGVLSPAADAQPSCLRLIAYDSSHVVEHQCQDLAEIDAKSRGMANVWIDVEGLGDVDKIRAIGQRHNLHPLTLEDIVQTAQRPKVETYDGYLFIMLRLPHYRQGLVTDPLAIVLGEGFVLTFGERSSDALDAVRHRLTQAGSRMRNRQIDYLAYAVIDALIDHFFPILEHYGELIEQLEGEIVQHATSGLAADIHAIRREVMEVRRAIWPLRAVLNTLMQESTPHFAPETRVFLRDCSDHVYQLLDMIEIDREVTSTLLDLHLSSLSTRMNEIMKVLTIIATIFIPLGFFAGVYGMNFDPSVSPYNMPELQWRYGYPYALLVMASVAFGMLYYFWSKGWIGDGRRRREHKGSDRTK